jgi:hypothetical protein
MRWQGVYRRDYENGIVLVNPYDRDVDVALETPAARVLLSGGGAVGRNGIARGTIATRDTKAIRLAGKSAAIFIR